MTRFLVTGASGLLGLNFALQTAGEHEVIGVVNRHGLLDAPFPVIRCDLNQPGEVERLLLETRPEVVLNCAAYANLDACEAQPEQAYYLNAIVPGALARVTARQNIFLVHFSTDAVFDGFTGGYTETSPTNPINIYARTKLAGEKAVLAANADALIARVNFYGWSLRGRRSLGEYFFNNLSAGKQVQGFTDVYFCPLQVNELVDLLLTIVDRRLSGLYHVVSSECLSKYEYGIRVARQFGFDESLITPTSWKDSDLVAPRAPNLSLSVEKLTCALGSTPPGVQNGLVKFYDQYAQGYQQRLLDMGQVAFDE